MHKPFEPDPVNAGVGTRKDHQSECRHFGSRFGLIF